MPGKPRRDRLTQLATVLSYQTVAMGLMLLAASFLADFSVADQPQYETAATAECSPVAGAGQAAAPAGTAYGGDFLDLTVAWLIN